MRHAHWLAAILLFLALGYAAPAGGMAAAGHDMTEIDIEVEEWDEGDDAVFLYGMIEHHKAAVDMALKVVKTSKDEDVQRWAKGVIALQEKEISQMQKMIADLGLDDTHGAAAVMREHMRMMEENPASPDADVNFVAQMVPHHAGAIEMSLPALVESENPQLRVLARDIIKDQAGEIYEFTEWLKKKGY